MSVYINDCVFCKIVNDQIPSAKVFETEDVIAILDISPLNYGHILVLPKTHFGFFDECPEDILAKVVMVSAKVATAVKNGVGAEGYNIVCNNGKAAGQLIGHLHFHIIPRFAGDGIFDRWPAKKYEVGQADKILEKIRTEL